MHRVPLLLHHKQNDRVLDGTDDVRDRAARRGALACRERRVQIHGRYLARGHDDPSTAVRVAGGQAGLVEQEGDPAALRETRHQLLHHQTEEELN